MIQMDIKKIQLFKYQTTSSSSIYAADLAQKGLFLGVI